MLTDQMITILNCNASVKITPEHPGAHIYMYGEATKIGNSAARDRSNRRLDNGKRLLRFHSRQRRFDQLRVFCFRSGTTLLRDFIGAGKQRPE